MSEQDNNTESQLVVREAGAPQHGAGGGYQLDPNIHIDEITSTIKYVLTMGDFPDDKKVEISVEFVVVPKTMNITISKK